MFLRAMSSIADLDYQFVSLEHGVPESHVMDTDICTLKVVSNEMNGGSDVVSIESYHYITQVLSLSLNFYWAVVF